LTASATFSAPVHSGLGSEAIYWERKEKKRKRKEKKRKEKKRKEKKRKEKNRLHLSASI